MYDVPPVTSGASEMVGRVELPLLGIVANEDAKWMPSKYCKARTARKFAPLL